MRILQISSAKGFGGGERHLVDLATGLLNRGHTVFLAAPPASPLPEKLVGLPAENVLAVRLRNALDLPSVWQLRRFIRQHQIDIVHAHLARDYPLAALAVRGAANAKLVVTRHVLFPMNALQRFVLNNVQGVIAVSQAVKKQLLADGVFRPDKIRVCYNAIDTQRFTKVNGQKLRDDFRRQYNIPTDALLISTIGELKPLKGQAEFVKAAKTILQQQPSAQFVIVGADNSPSQKFQRHLQDLIEQHNLTAKVLWIEQLDDVVPLLHATDVFVSASHSESFGLSIVEAMAAGCAVVATATAGALEVLNDETGKVVPVNDDEQLAQAVIELCANENQRRQLGERARQTAVEKFDLPRMIGETESIYRRILANG